MTSYAVLLRGNSILPVQAFRNLLQSLGCENVVSYIQSGNVVFQYEGDVKDLPVIIAAAIKSQFGFKPSVLILTASDFLAAAVANPFASEGIEAPFQHIWFTAETITGANVERLEELAVADERSWHLPSFFVH